jgi:hypothetical protein
VILPWLEYLNCVPAGGGGGGGGVPCVLSVVFALVLSAKVFSGRTGKIVNHFTLDRVIK